jgi:hypothetical protein
VTSRELARDVADGFAAAAGTFLGSLLLLVVLLFVIAWDLGNLLAPRVFEARRPLIGVGH